VGSRGLDPPGALPVHRQLPERDPYGRCNRIPPDFGHISFRSGQEDIVRAVLEGRDVLAVMPTGSGKSLGFQ
jgi:superfamily II DNA or RNA helicase